MAIAIVSTFRGHDATLERYDQAVQKLGGIPGGPHPAPGCLFHWAAPLIHGEEGFVITNVFTTPEAWAQFRDGKLAEVRKEVHLPDPAQTDIFQVHTFMTAH
jgi:hypothetical protein